MEFANSGAASRLHREAERWFVRLLDAAEDDPGRREFERWLAADPAHARAYRETARLWRLGEEAARHPDIMAEAARAACAAPASTLRSRFRLAPALGVALVLVATLTASAWIVFAGSHRGVHYSTAVAQQRTLHLQDGSTVLLDADSSVVVHYGRHEREVDLLRGRAEFQVRHDENWPFVVHAEEGTVTDVGTTFQVGIGRQGRVRVVLVEGEVSVATPHADTILTSGEALRFNQSGAVRGPYPMDRQAALGWMSGEIAAHDWRLPRLLDQMDRYSPIKVRIADATLKGLRVTGTFREGRQKTLIRILEAGWPIRARWASATKVELVRK